MKRLNLIMLKLSLGMLVLGGLAIQAAQERSSYEIFKEIATQIDELKDALDDNGNGVIIPEPVMQVLRRFNKIRGVVTMQGSVTQTDITAAENALEALRAVPRPLPVPQMRRGQEQEEEIKDIESEIVRAPDPQRVEQLLPGLPFHMREAPDDPELQQALAASRESAAQEERKLRGVGKAQEQTDDEEDKKEMAIVPYRPRMAPEREQVMREVVGGIKGVSTLTGHQLNTELMTLMSEYAASSWLNKNAEIESTPLDVHHIIRSIAISPNNELIVTASDDNIARIWNAAGQLIDTITGQQHLTEVAISPDSQSVFLSSFEGVPQRWNRTGEVLPLSDQINRADRIAISSDNTFIVIALNNRFANSHIRILDRTGNLLHTLTFPKRISALKISPDNSFIVLAFNDNTLEIVSPSGKTLHTLTGKRHHSGQDLFVTSIAISSDSNFIVTLSRNDDVVRIWNRSGQLLRTLTTGPYEEMSAIAIDPLGEFIVTGFKDGTVRIWNFEGVILHILLGHSDRISAIAIDPKGQFIATGSADGTVRIWNREGQLIHILKQPNFIDSIAISQDGQFIVVSSSSPNAVVRIWRLVE